MRLIPPPRVNMHSYFGVFSAHSKLRAHVVEQAGPSGALLARLGEARERQAITPTSPSARIWALLIARIYEVLPLLCPRCGAPMRLIAFITLQSQLTRILEHLDVPSTPTELTQARGPPQMELDMNQLLDDELDMDQSLYAPDDD